MKTLLTILSTLSLASPIISVSAGTFTTYMDEQDLSAAESDSLDDLANVKGEGDDVVKDTDITNPVKISTNNVNNETLKNAIGDNANFFTTTNYSVNSDLKDGKFIDAGGNEGDMNNDVSFGQPSMYQFSMSNKTIMGGKDGSITWAGVNDGQVILRDLGITPQTSNRNGAKPVVPFSYIDENNDNYGFAMTVTSSTTGKLDQLSWIDVTDGNTDIAQSGVLTFPKGNIDISQINQKTNQTFSSILSIAGIRELNSKSEKFANKIILGLQKDDAIGHIFYYVFDVNYDTEKGNECITLSQTENSTFIDAAVDKGNAFPGTLPQVYAILKDGNILLKAGSGENAVYFLGSELLQTEKPVTATGKSIITALKAASNAVNLYKDTFVLTDIEWTPGDNQLIIDSYDSADKKTSETSPHYIFKIDVTDGIDGNLSFTNARWLFTTAAASSKTGLLTFSQLQTGSVYIPGTTTRAYNYIMFTAGQYKTYIFRYSYSNGGSSNINKNFTTDINASVSDQPILEVLAQSNFDITKASKYDLNHNASIQTTIAIDGSFISMQQILGEEEVAQGAVVVTPKIDASQIQLPDLALVDQVFKNVDIAFSDMKRNDNQLRRAYLEALIQGKFEYRKSMVIINPDDQDSSTDNGSYTNSNIESRSLHGRLSTASTAEKAFAARLDDIAYKIDGQFIADLRGNEHKDASMIISVTSDAMNNLLNYNKTGAFNDFEYLTLSGSGKNSVVKGEENIKVTSSNTTAIDFNDINRGVNNAIKEDTNGTFQLHFDSPSEATGYIMNKIEDVFYDEGRQYLVDQDIPMMYNDYVLNNAVVDDPKKINDEWGFYYGKSTPSSVYTSAFDGTRPFVMRRSEINPAKHETEKQMRNNMGWGFQSYRKIENLNKATENGMVNIDLTNIMITKISEKINFMRADRTNMTYDDGKSGGILNYGSDETNDDIEEMSALLNIGQKNGDGKYTNLKVLLPESSLLPMYETESGGDYTNIDGAAAADLDKAASILHNQVIDGTYATDETSFFRYFERMKKAFNLDNSIQFSMYANSYEDNNFWMPTGDNYVDIMIYDAIFFQGMDNVTSASKTANTTDLYNNGHYRLVRVYLSNVNNETANTSWIIYGGFFGGIFVTLFVAYTIFVSIRKSFYKRGTTREAAKNAARLHAIEKQERKLRKKNHEPEPPVDDLTDAEDLG
jgi:hypothetical protein